MLAFRPYGKHEVRVVSDTSRFEYGAPRNRSRNTTPTSIDDEKSSNITFDSIIPPYSSRIHNYEQPNLHRGLHDISELLLPISKTRSSPNLHKDMPPVPNESSQLLSELPPVMDTRSYAALNNRSAEAASISLELMNSRQKRLEVDLIKRVMNRPLLSIPARYLVGTERYENQMFNISANFFLYLFEILFSISVITLSGVLLNLDHDLGKGFFQFFMADAVISLFVSVLFITTVINFEKRNGSFYCLAATLLKVVSFIMVTSHVIPQPCASKTVCSIRRAISAMIIISTFLWIGNLVMFLTTLYISRLNLLNDINFDYSDRGLNTAFNEPQVLQEKSHFDDLKDPVTGERLKEFYLDNSGDMYEIQHRLEVQGKNKIIVYTHPAFLQTE